MRIAHDRVVFRSGFRLAATVPLLCRLLVPAACFVSLAPAAGGEPFRLPPADRFEVYEALRGNLDEAENYHFSVSPDEQWIAVARSDSSELRSRLLVLHRPTRRTWESAPGGKWERLDEPGWRPDCFSADSKRIYFADRMAVLSPAMEALDLRPAPPIPRSEYFQGSFVGRNPYVVDDESQRDGTKVWSPVRRILYESLAQGQVKSSFLRVWGPGTSVGVDYAALYDVLNGQMRSIAAELRASTKQHEGTLTPEQRRIVQAMEPLLRDVDGSSADVRLSNLTISPDGRVLAGVAELDRSGGVFAGPSFGVLIPLDRGGFAAFPFAENVYGKSMWSADSTAVYFYAQPKPGCGNGTVHRLALSNLVLPARIPETTLSQEKLRAPSDGELARASYEKVKEAHYGLLHAEFSKPQTIREFNGHWGFTDAGQVIELYGATFARADGIESYVAAHFLHRPVKLVLPDRDDFVKSYIPAMRTGVYGDASKYPWRSGAGAQYGVVPVLIYDAGGLVNSRFSKSESLRKYR